MIQTFGYIASFLFFLRFFVQWIFSEKKKKSHVTPSFWVLSLLANMTMALHGYIQSQFPILLIQSSNAIISLRNLDLMRKKGSLVKTKTVIIFMLTTLSLLSLGFVLKGHFIWMKSPLQEELSFIWHAFGFLGMTLFASRFWFQWWTAEKEKQSCLHSSFWKISVIGGMCSLIYCIALKDPVQILGFSMGLIPYLRNLKLIKKQIKQPLKKDLLFFVAGETSGDVLGQDLLLSLRKKSPHLLFKGVGGSLMKEAGLQVSISSEALNVMGITDVIMTIPRLVKIFYKIKWEILSTCPEKVILIDYQDFNMRLAQSLRKSGYQGEIIQYVSPSIWAWREKRKFTLAKTHNLLLSIFPFEKQHYKNTTLEVKYVGHPLVKKIAKTSYQATFCDSFRLSSQVISLFPGSRNHEIKRNLPLQLEIAKKWLASHSGFSLAISSAHAQCESLIKDELKKQKIEATIIPFSARYDLMHNTTIALATSGTVILELGLHKVPTVVTYLLSHVNYFLAKSVFHISLPHYCLVNIIAGKEIYPEFYDKFLPPDIIFRSLENLYLQKESCREKLDHLQISLGALNAAESAADAIVDSDSSFYSGLNFG